MDEIQLNIEEYDEFTIHVSDISHIMNSTTDIGPFDAAIDFQYFALANARLTLCSDSLTLKCFLPICLNLLLQFSNFNILLLLTPDDLTVAKVSNT